MFKIDIRIHGVIMAGLPVALIVQPKQRLDLILTLLPMVLLGIEHIEHIMKPVILLPAIQAPEIFQPAMAIWTC
jgi:hypothetical protein